MAAGYGVLRSTDAIGPPLSAISPPGERSSARPPTPASPSVRQRPADPSRASPSANAPIYRCGNSYSHEPCVGGHAIETHIAAGFNSRPSERLARLVADGRSAASEGMATPGITPFASNGMPFESSSGTGGGECPGLASEIVAIDAAARHPQAASRQDQLRERRRRVRDRQGALHC